MPKHIVKSGKTIGIAVVLALIAFTARAQNLPPKDIMLGEKVMGRADAPVTLIEYASLTCSHCAALHTGALVQIKKEYIDTGKVRLIYRDFPLDQLAEAGSMLARCAAKERYFPMIEILYRSQSNWARAANPAAALAQLGRLAGISQKTFDACLTNRELYDSIIKSRTTGTNKWKVEGTPTMFLNDRIIEGELTAARLRKVLDNAIAKAGK
ncbi:MAG: DsbA family protein [Rhodospirillales bacterium]|jgi:protein-disulfide isomerase|nr:DsbA family protein [Rhodospirillales bacterium]MDP6642972.1 DsbA family protein [Rhodospirillales bacterium]MDP6840727.1 DsbA family protein [Rhodospirillales bacterium]|tara:strand:+ start:1395 stop:2027 length:633 start_codon:yes stop_codon:yes gene_type:complete